MQLASFTYYLLKTYEFYFVYFGYFTTPWSINGLCLWYVEK